MFVLPDGNELLVLGGTRRGKCYRACDVRSRAQACQVTTAVVRERGRMPAVRHGNRKRNTSMVRRKARRGGRGASAAKRSAPFAEDPQPEAARPQVIYFLLQVRGGQRMIAQPAGREAHLECAWACGQLDVW